MVIRPVTKTSITCGKIQPTMMFHLVFRSYGLGCCVEICWSYFFFNISFTLMYKGGSPFRSIIRTDQHEIHWHSETMNREDRISTDFYKCLQDEGFPALKYFAQEFHHLAQHVRRHFQRWFMLNLHIYLSYGVNIYNQFGIESQFDFSSQKKRIS